LAKYAAYLAIFCKFDQKHSTVDQMRTHLAKRCTFGQMLQVSSIGQCATHLGNWANALCICPNAQIGQMCLTATRYAGIFDL